MAIALDVSTPSAVFGTANPITSAPIIAPAGSMFFAICIADESNTFAISNPSGSALTWTSVGVSVSGAGFTSIQVYWAYDPVGGSRTVRSTRTGSFSAHGLKVLVFTGTETTFTGAKSSATTDTTNIVTTANNSWVWAGHGDENAGLDTPAASCTFNDGPTAFGGIAGGVIKRSATTPTSGTSVTIGTSAGTLPALVAFEVKEGSGAPALTGNAFAGRWPNTLAPGHTRRNVKISFSAPFQMLGDTSSGTGPVDYVKSTSDPVSITDTTALSRNAAQTDAVGLTDAVIVKRTFGITDPINETDQRSSGRGATTTDPVGLTDTRVTGRTTTRTDPVGITDSVKITRTTALTDSIGITDTRSYTDGENQNDPIGITDGTTRVVTAVRSPADPVGITDARTAARGKTQTDAVGITDSATGVISLTKTITDPIGITDAQTKSRRESSGETVGLTDSVSVTKTVVRTVSDAVGVTDTRAYNDGENYVDPVTITDTRSVARTTSRTDTVGIADARSVTRGVIRSDNLGVTDTRTVARGKLTGDTVGVTDATTSTRSIHVTIDDSVGLTDFIPQGTVRDICVSLAGGPRVRSRALTGPRLASHALDAAIVGHDVTGPARPSLEVESLGANAHTTTGPYTRARTVTGPRLRLLVTSEGIQPRTVNGPRSC